MTSINLTSKEVEFLTAVDWKVIADQCGFANPKRARDRWYPLRDKLFGAPADGATQPGEKPAQTAATPKSKGKKAAAEKRKATADEDDEEATPTKKSKSDKSDSVVKQEPEAEEENKLV